MTLICGRPQIHSRCGMLFVAIKSNLHSVRPSRNGSEWPRINKLFCYVCVFLCESVAIIKVSSIRLAAFQASEAHICHYHLRAFIRIPGWISCYSISNLRSRPIGIDWNLLNIPTACCGVVNFKPLFKVFKIDLWNHVLSERLFLDNLTTLLITCTINSSMINCHHIRRNS